MIRVGILGCGRIARTMSKTLLQMQEEGIHLAAFASRTESKARQYADEYHAEKAYGSYEALASDPDIDLIYIATPHSEHFENAKLCLTHGKHVLLEKAFTTNHRLTEELCHLAEEKGLLLAEAIWTRYMPSRKILSDILADKPVGEPYYLSANLGYPISHKERLMDPALAGGALLDVGIYPLNFASMVFGDDYQEVHAHCTYTKKGVDETDVFTLIYQDGKLADLNCSMVAQTDRRGIIYCSKGFIEVDNINNPLLVRIYDQSYKPIKTIEMPKQINGYEYEVREVRDAILNHQTECSSMPHAQTILMMKLMDDIRKKMNLIYPFERNRNQ